MEPFLSDSLLPLSLFLSPPLSLSERQSPNLLFLHELFCSSPSLNESTVCLHPLPSLSMPQSLLPSSLLLPPAIPA